MSALTLRRVAVWGLLLFFVSLWSVCSVYSAGKHAPQVSYYCDVADPLGLVYVDASAMSEVRRLSSLRTNSILSNGRGCIASEEVDDSGMFSIIEVYRAGNMICRRRFPSDQTDPLGWDRNGLIVRVGKSLVSINSATGRASTIGHADNTTAVAATSSGEVRVSDNSRASNVEFVRKGHVRRRWSRYVHTSDLRMVGDRFVVLECNPIKGSVIDGSNSGLWTIDLLTGRERYISTGAYNNGFCAGRNENELLLATRTHPGGIRLQSIQLRSGMKSTITILHGDQHLTSLVGLAPDRRSLLLNTGYAAVGPGKLWSLDLQTRSQMHLMDNVYDCVLPGSKRNTD